MTSNRAACSASAPVNNWTLRKQGPFSLRAVAASTSPTISTVSTRFDVETATLCKPATASDSGLVRGAARHDVVRSSAFRSSLCGSLSPETGIRQIALITPHHDRIIKSALLIRARMWASPEKIDAGADFAEGHQLGPERAPKGMLAKRIPKRVEH
jgi:hypothetical protein